MNERLKELRKTLNLTQEKFANRLGIKKNTISQYESGRNEPIDAVILSICREFNVSESWLRDGVGDMFIAPDRNFNITRLTKQLLNEEADSFKNRFVSMLAELSVEEWALLEQLAIRLNNNHNTENHYIDIDELARRVPDTYQELEALYEVEDIDVDADNDVG